MKYIIPIILIGLLPFYVKAETPDFLVLKRKKNNSVLLQRHADRIHHGTRRV